MVFNCIEATNTHNQHKLMESLCFGDSCSTHKNYWDVVTWFSDLNDEKFGNQKYNQTIFGQLVNCLHANCPNMVNYVITIFSAPTEKVDIDNYFPIKSDLLFLFKLGIK